VVPNPAIHPGKVVVQASLLPLGALNQWGAVTTIGNSGQLPPNPPPAHVPAGGQLCQAPWGAAGPNVPPAQVNIAAAKQGGQAFPGAAVPNVPAAGHLGQAPVGAPDPNVPAADVNVAAGGQVGKAPPGAAGPNVPAAQLNVPAAGQRRQAPWGQLVPTYRLHKSTSLLPNKAARLSLVQLFRTSLLLATSGRLL